MTILMHEKISKFLIIIPARKNSKGIPRKNLRIVGGKPLICWSISNALSTDIDADVYVTTDGVDIADVATMYGVGIVHRPPHLALDDVPLAPVICHAVNQVELDKKCRYDWVIILQPTAPMLRSETLNKAIHYSMVSGCDTVISVKNHPHLAWCFVDGTLTPMYSDRLNRQQLPPHYMETGAFFITRRDCVKENTFFGTNVKPYEISEVESIDIDTYHDMWLVNGEMKRRRILIRVEGFRQIGLGHVYRGLHLAGALMDHDVMLCTSSQSVDAIKVLDESCYPYMVFKSDDEMVDHCRSVSYDIVINDILDTDAHYVRKLKRIGIRVVNFEDLGSGAKSADLVINDLYDKRHNSNNHLWGSQYHCLRDHFVLAKRKDSISEKVGSVLIMFGGTDPNMLTERVAHLLCEHQYHEQHIVHIVVGLGNLVAYERLVQRYGKNANVKIVHNTQRLASIMYSCDMAISSMGRTMYELAHISVPTILIAQNERELLHDFGDLNNGFVNLGLHSHVDDVTIYDTVKWLSGCFSVRQQMHRILRKHDFTANTNAVIQAILGQ